jgi:two-component system cell cycle sensor histidine kinase/response regulator CckA
MNTHRQTERRAAYILILIFVLLAAGIVAAGSLYYRNYEKQYRAEVESQLSAIADLKVGELVQFRRERLGDGAILFRNASFSALVRRFLANPRDADAQRQIQVWIGKYQVHHHYDRVFLLDTRGVERMSAPTGPDSIAAIVSRRASETLRSGLVTFQDFYRNEHNQRIDLAVLVPIFDEPASRRPLGVLVLRIDPETYLYPFLSRWPIPSRTAETLLVRRDGNDVLFLNNLKFGTDAALNLRIPLTKGENPAANAALGREGLVEGVDYRGVPAIAQVRRVPDAPWFLVARMDTSEVYAPLRERLWEIVGLAGALLLGAAGATGLVWRRQSMRFYWERYRAAEALAESEEKFRSIAEQSSNLIALTDAEGVIVYASPACMPLFHAKPEEMSGCHFAQFLDQSAVSTATAAFRGAMEHGRSMVNLELGMKRKDGSTFVGDLTGSLWSSSSHRGTLVTISDITERKRAEDALRASEERHRTILQTAMDGFWLADTQGHLLEVNETYCRMSGYTARELLAMQVPDLEANETASDTAAHIQKVLARGEDRFESRHRRKDGSVFDVEASVQYRPTEGGRLVSFLHDITGRKRAEEALRAERDRAQRYLDIAGVILAGLTPDQTIVLINRKGCDLLGYTQEELLGQNWFDLVVPERERDKVKAVFAGLMQGELEPLEDVENLVVTRSGEQRVVAWHNTLVRDAAGAIAGTLSSGQDITDRKRAEEALRESEDRYRNLFEQSGDCILLLELRDGPPLILDANQAALRACGYSLEELAGQPISLLEPGITREIVEERTRLMAEGKPLYMRHRRKDGSEFDVESVARRVQVGPRNVVLAVERDITERKRAEAEREHLQLQLAQAQKMESIGRLAGGIAHDFNNLLTVINGYSLLLLGKLSAADPLRAGLKEIHKAGERAAGLTLQLLAFSRKQILEPRVLDLNHEVDEMRPMLGCLVGDDVEVRVELSAEAGSVHADPHQLEQVIMNLVVNARDAMPHGGKLLIETAGVELDQRYVQSHPEAHTGRHVLLAVSDTGVGMDDETRRQIFEPFFTTKGVGKGTGLGLSMVQGIVAQSGGHIEVYSEPGRGTTFKIYLPRVEGEAAADAGMQEIAPSLGGTETVLVVEDQAEVREYAVTVLEAYGYRVIPAESAGQALLMFEREPERIDLVLTDVVMPNISGRELANRLEKLQPGIKVLFMSGYTDNVIVHHGVLEEGAQFIQKPFSPEQLAVRVREVLGPP